MESTGDKEAAGRLRAGAGWNCLQAVAVVSVDTVATVAVAGVDGCDEEGGGADESEC